MFEVSQIYAGPYAGQTLADLGADVVKCEPRGGEAVRLWGQFAPGESKDFHTLNRGNAASSWTWPPRRARRPSTGLSRTSTCS